MPYLKQCAKMTAKDVYVHVCVKITSLILNISISNYWSKLRLSAQKQGGSQSVQH